MTEDKRETNIWEYLAVRIGKHIAKEAKVKLTFEMLKAVMREIEDFQRNHLVQIYFSLPTNEELAEVRKTVDELFQQSLNKGKFTK
jgi:hypothetical protein